MKKTLETLHCSCCGGTNVQIMAWVDANTNKYCSDVNTPPEDEDTWCDNCEDHTGLRTLKELWDEFSEVLVDADDNIESDFLCFPAGASKFDVWHWFDERCPNCLAVDLMGEKPNDI